MIKITDFAKKAKFLKKSYQGHQRMTIIGKIGGGKSVFFDTMLHFLKNKHYIVLIDTKKEYTHLPIWTTDSMELETGLFRVVEIFNEGFHITNMKDITEIMSDILFNRGNCIMAVEELSNCTKKSGELSDTMPYFNKVITQGRSRRVGFIGTTQRAQQIPSTILTQSEHLIIFRLTSDLDKKRMQEYVDKEDWELLRQHEFFHNDLKSFPQTLKICYKLYVDVKFYNKIFGKS